MMPAIAMPSMAMPVPAPDLDDGIISRRRGRQAYSRCRWIGKNE